MWLLECDAAFDADPKTDAGKQTVTVPPHVLPVLAGHMASWAGPDRCSSAHFAFSDEARKGLRGVGEIAPALVNNPLWDFWWD